MDPQLPERSREGVLHVEVEVDHDGPPMPPPARRRRRRRRLLTALAVIVVLGVPVSLAVAGAFPDEPAPSASGSDEASPDEGADDEGADDGSADDAPSEPGDDPDALDRPDLDGLDGADAVYGQLLVEIDRSEQVMIGFQDEVAEVFSEPADTPQGLIESLQGIGATRRDALLEVRGALDDALPEEGAELVRSRYLDHLDSWADYLGAVSEDPSVLGGEGEGAGYNVVINATADAFARALEEELPDVADPQVRAYGERILDRGFRSAADAQV